MGLLFGFSGSFGNSTAGLPIISKEPLSDEMIILFSKTSNTNLVSSLYSFITPKTLCTGIVTSPILSTLVGNFTLKETSKSVALKILSFSLTLNKTLLKIGNVDLEGITFESFNNDD